MWMWENSWKKTVVESSHVPEQPVRSYQDTSVVTAGTVSSPFDPYVKIKSKVDVLAEDQFFL